MQNEPIAWVDPHIHFFALDEGDYHWLKAANPPMWADKSHIAKPHFERDLVSNSKNSLAGFVHIEAGYDNAHPWREVQFLEKHCTKPFKAVAGIDLLSSSAASHINTLSSMKSVSGLRHILDEDALFILQHPKALWCFSHMSALGLSFDVQADMGCAKTVNILLRILTRNPSLKMTVNHSAVAPRDTTSLAFFTWRKNIKLLGSTGQVAFKFSGLEMQDRVWSWQTALTRFDVLMSEVGEDAIMFASNFPLCTWRMPYGQLWRGYERLTKGLTTQAQQKLCSQNALTWYGF